MFKLAAIVLVFLVFSGCSPKKRTPPTLPYVTVAEVKVEERPLYLEYVGHVEANQSVEVRAQVAGMLMGQYFMEGQPVGYGDTLLMIDPRPFEAALAKAEGELAQNLARLRQAQDTKMRYEKLLLDNFVSQLDYDQFVTNVYTAEADVQKAYADVATARINLDYCTIKAPLDAVASKLLIDVGNYVPIGGTPLLTLNQVTPIRVRFNVPEKDLPRILEANNQSPLKVIVSLQQQEIEGALFLINNQVDIKTGTILIEALFPNEDKKLWPGEFVDVRLILEIKKEALVIPSQALFVGQEGLYVYVVKSSSLNNQEVESD